MPELSSEWTAELKKGSIQLCLLALLAGERKYGFQLIKELRELSAGFFDVKEGTLYPALRRLEGADLRHRLFPGGKGGNLRNMLPRSDRSIEPTSTCSISLRNFSTSCRVGSGFFFK